MDSCWSRDDKLFVDAKLEVLWFNLSFASSPSESLPMERRSGIVYDGPKSDDFKGFLSKLGYRVNRKGRVIVAVTQDDEKVKAFHYFLIDKVVPLGPYGFPNNPLPKWKESMELQTLLDKTKAELAKKNDELNETRIQLEEKNKVMKKEVMESQSLLRRTEAELAKKNYELSESRRQLDDIQTALMKKTVDLRYARFAPCRVLGGSSNIFEFLRRMNGTYVNAKGVYMKMDFTAAKSSGPWVTSDNRVYYYEKDYQAIDPFSFVQFDWDRHAMDIQQRQVVLPKIREDGCRHDMYWYGGDPTTDISALTFKEFCFIGSMSKASGTFFENALVTVFFEQTEYDKDNCYVDALATTFFVFNSRYVDWREASEIEIPRFI